MSLRRLVAAGVALVIPACAASTKAAKPPASTAKPAVAVIARLSGVGVTWLPPHFTPEGADLTPVARGSRASQDFRGTAGAKAAPRLSLLVERGAPAVFDLSRQEGIKPTLLTIRRHSALLASFPADGTPAFPAPTYYLQWLEQPGLTLTVSAAFGATASDAKRMAAGLVIHPADTSLPTAADVTEVRAAFEHAFTGGTLVATVLGGVENGQSLAGVLAQLGARAPQTRTTRVSVRDVTFSDPSHASATVGLTHWGVGGSDITGGQQAVKVGGRWHVTEHSYCMTVEITGVDCPGT